jgi:hypothetical protein
MLAALAAGAGAAYMPAAAPAAAVACTPTVLVAAPGVAGSVLPAAQPARLVLAALAPLPYLPPPRKKSRSSRKNSRFRWSFRFRNYYKT